MKKIVDLLFGFILVILLLAVLGFFLKDAWNLSVVPLFHAREMTLTMSMASIILIWIVTRVAAGAFTHAFTSEFSTNLRDTLDVRKQ